MDKLQDNHNDLKTPYFSFGDVLALGLIIATGLYFIITSSLKIALLVFGTMNAAEFFMNIMGVIVGYGLIFGAYRFVKRSSFLKSFADSIFVEGIYDRLEPLLIDIAETRAGYDILSERIDDLNYNVNDIRRSIELGKGNPSNDLIPVQFALRNITHQFQYTMLTTITLAVYMFMYYNPGTLVPYLSPVVFALWWALITSQHDLWETPKPWYWVAVPILFIPMYTILFSAIYTANTMLLIMYVGLAVYVLSYYTWCEYMARGILPFGVGDRIHNIKTMLKGHEVPEAKPRIEKPVFRPYHIGSILIMFSILIFALSMAGYMIENKLVKISWQTIGLNITWQPLYFYGTILLGTLLLIVGSVFVLRFRKYK